MRELEKRMSANGVTFAQIIDAEASSIIQSAMSRTRMAQAKNIKRAMERRIPKKSDAGWYTLPNGQPRMRHWRVKDADWQRYKAKVQSEQRARLASRGLAKQGWLALAEHLKLELKKVPAQVRKARSIEGIKVNQKVGGGRSANPQKYQIMLRYSNPLGRHTGATAALRKAINGRTGYFYRNLRSGALDTAEGIAAKYPGLRVIK